MLIAFSRWRGFPGVAGSCALGFVLRVLVLFGLQVSARFGLL